MDTVGEEEPEPIKLKSLKNNRVFTVPQNDRVGKEKQRLLLSTSRAKFFSYTRILMNVMMNVTLAPFQAAH